MPAAPAPSLPDRAPLRIVIAEPHPTMRRALRALLALEPGLVVVADVAALAPAGAAVRRYRADALVVASSLYRETPRALGPIASATLIVAAGMDDTPGLAGYARGLGADAYVVKDEAHVRLPALLRSLTQAETRTGAAGVAPPS